MVKVVCFFDYQSIFKHENCLHDLGTALESEQDSTSSQVINTFCGTSYFKSGAAVDKMG
jgi:hypothetical protein